MNSRGLSDSRQSRRMPLFAGHSLTYPAPMRASAATTISEFGPSTGIEIGQSSTTRRLRVGSVVAVRGIAMILMALDHTRDFFGVAGDPTNLAQASTALFLTRWVTHVCAPTFFLLTGTGAALSLSRKSRDEL